MDQDIKPLDGGWAWVIVFGVGLVTTIQMGFGKAFALIYPELLFRYQDTDLNTSLVLTIWVAFLFFSGPVASYLANTFSHRRVVIAGGILACTGLVVSGYAPSLTVMYISYGLLVGIGNGLVIGPCFTMVIMYFNKKRGIAIALSTVTGNLGAVIMAPLVAWLLQECGYTGTMVICGGITLNICIAGALFRPLEDNYPKRRNNGNNENSLMYKTKGEQKYIVNFNGNADLVDTNVTSPLDTSKDTFSSFHNMEMVPYGSIADIKTNVKQLHQNKNTGMKSTGWKIMCFSICKTLDIALLKDITFVLFTLTVCVVYFSLQIYSIFLSGYAIEKGFSQSEVTTLIIILNISEGVFRLASGFVFDLSLVKRNMLTIFSLIGVAQHAGLIVLTFLRNKSVLYVVMSVTVGLNGVLHSQLSNVLGNVVEPARLTAAYGIMRFITGIGVMVAPTVGGGLKDATGYYQWCYLFSGGLGLLQFLVLLIHQLFLGIKNTRNIRKPELNEATADEESK